MLEDVGEGVLLVPPRQGLVGFRINKLDPWPTLAAISFLPVGKGELVGEAVLVIVILDTLVGEETLFEDEDEKTLSEDGLLEPETEVELTFFSCC